MDVSLQVFKEPRGFIRVIQCILAIVAFSTTAGFATQCEFRIDCDGTGSKEAIPFEYKLGYPFSMSGHDLILPTHCDTPDKRTKIILPFDFSSAAEFFVATGVLSFLYTILALVVYMFFHQNYINNPQVPVADLGITAVLSIFWLAGSSAWAQGVSDLKYYMHPETIFKMFPICSEESSERCSTVEDGSYGTLNASLILGFANFLLWSSSLWFIYKETVFHTPDIAPTTTQNQTPKDVGRV